MPSLINPFWFAPKDFSDNFNRTTSGSLGTSSSGQPWTALRGVWFADGTQGSSSDNAANYPIASYDIGLQNTTSKIDSGPGTGVAFWVTDANSWWAAYPFYNTTSSSVCNQGLVSSYGNPPAGNCCSGVSSSTQSSCDTGLVSSTSNPPAGNCCSGVSSGTSSTTVCNAGYQTGLTSTSSCCGASTATCNGGYGTYNTDANCCSTATTSTGYYCPAGILCSANNTCRATSSCSSSFIMNAYQITQYSCFTSNTYACNTQTTTTTTTTYSCYTGFSTSTIYSCYTSNTTTFTYESAIRIISSVSGTVVTDSTTTLASSNSSHPAISSIEVSTSGDTITAKGYSSAGQVSQLGSTITRTPSSPTKGTSIGIIKAPSSTGQSSNVDNYSVTV